MTGMHTLACYQIVLDTTDARGLAEFYRALLDYTYRPGDEPPAPGDDDPRGHDWLVIHHPDGTPRIAFQQVPELPAATWPTGPRPQQLHLDFIVPTIDDLDTHHTRALALGATLLHDLSTDPQEPLRVYADPAGHPFCVFFRPTRPDTDG